MSPLYSVFSSYWLLLFFFLFVEQLIVASQSVICDYKLQHVRRFYAYLQIILRLRDYCTIAERILR